VRPIRLELYNFLAYRQPSALNFEGLHLACLSGTNGAGKSSLLDAITWALWGKSRAKNNDDDKLVHLGQEEMAVLLDFRQESALYRVIRKYSRKRKTARSTVELLSWDESVKSWRTIQESESSRETEKQITRLLGLDYETFVNSAFLQQNRADSFAVMTRGQRKEILAEILGLSRWSDYEDRAKEKLDDLKTELGNNQTIIDEILREEASEGEIQAKLANAEQRLEKIRVELSSAEAHLGEVSDAPARLQAILQHVDTAQRHLRDMAKDIENTEKVFRDAEAKQTKYQRVIAQEAEIREGFERLAAAKQLDSQLTEARETRNELQQHAKEIGHQLDLARSERTNALKAIAKAIREAEEEAKAVESARQELDALRPKLAEYEALQAEATNLQAQEKALIEEKATLSTQNKALKAEMQELRTTLDKLEQSQEALCPYCHRPLDEAHLEQLQTEGKARANQHRENDKRIKAIDQQVDDLHKRLQTIERVRLSTEKQKKQEGILTERIEKAADLARRIEDNRAQAEVIQQELDTESFNVDLRTELGEVSAQIDDLGYDEEAHRAARQDIKNLAKFEEEKRSLDIALESLPDVRNSIEHYANQLEMRRDQLTNEQQALKSLMEERKAVEALVLEEQQRRAVVKKLRGDERSELEIVTAHKQELNALEKNRQRKQNLLARQQILRDELAIYEQLRDAFGKNGVPAMIIEAAIPELEEKANEVLTRMTDGRMHIGFKTQKATKGGSVIETLDIEISDELGTRDYDLFSGGEGFRVNFALRIALSQFLARRAGARLQTLVIDEGFGSQDQVGRERLVEAINSIRDEFDLILIVTHIDELRDAFPAHIEVQKTATGSTVTVR